MAGDKADVLVLAPKQAIVEGLEPHFGFPEKGTSTSTAGLKTHRY